MPPVSAKELVLAAIEANLRLVTKANGYSNDIALVDRQQIQLRDEILPCFFVNDSNEQLSYYPAELTESDFTYVVMGGYLASDHAAGVSSKLGTELNAFIADFKKVMYSNLFLNTGNQDLLADHHLVSITTDEGMLNPKALFVARCSAQFRYAARVP